ncbi:MAG TPA: hypothetical protein VFC63_26795 [Blastocatellia bacterium]|nr:hypothetical protein [Blastocatellia bacterium]
METLQNSQLWQAFEQQARRTRRNPADILAELVRDYLDIAEDVKLTNEMRRDAQKSGLKAADAVKLVRRHRAEKRKRIAAS